MFNSKVCIAFLAVWIGCSSAQDCNLGGEWYNQHGSHLSVTSEAGGSLRGSFTNAVKHSPEGKVADMETHEILGKASDHGVLSFSVFFRNSTRVTVWTGQCQKCNEGKEVLFTTWILTEPQSTCDDLWKAHRVGQDIFSRQRPGTSNELPTSSKATLE